MSILQPPFSSLKRCRRPRKGCKIDTRSCENVNFATTINSLKPYGRPTKGFKIDKKSYENINFATTLLFTKSVKKAHQG